MKHGQSQRGKKTPTYNAWGHMISRCYDCNDKRFSRYGGRGITVAPEWKNFEQFFADMGEKPQGLTLERLDNEKGYSKGNCKWATWQEQAENKGLYVSSTTRIKGIGKVRTSWRARSGGGNGKFKLLYQGPDFFEACCARKAWEVQRLGELK